MQFYDSRVPNFALRIKRNWGAKPGEPDSHSYCCLNLCDV